MWVLSKEPAYVTLQATRILRWKRCALQPCLNLQHISKTCFLLFRILHWPLAFIAKNNRRPLLLTPDNITHCCQPVTLPCNSLNTRSMKMYLEHIVCRYDIEMYLEHIVCRYDIRNVSGTHRVPLWYRNVSGTHRVPLWHPKCIWNTSCAVRISKCIWNTSCAVMISKLYFRRCFLRLRHLVTHTDRRTHAEGVWEKGT
jgi:hypothetical protein